MKKTISLFGKLGAAYGHLWQNQFKDTDMFKFAKELWAKKIEALENFELSFGFEKCINNLEFPPTLPQFIKKCEIEPEDLGYLPSYKAWILKRKDELAKEIYEKVLPYNPHVCRTEKQQEIIFKDAYENFVKEQIAEINKNKKEKLQFIKQKLLIEEKQNVPRLCNYRMAKKSNS
jgi:hypothetical protein